MNRFKLNQLVRINDAGRRFHNAIATVVAVSTFSYDVTVGSLRMRVVPEQLIGVPQP